MERYNLPPLRNFVLEILYATKNKIECIPVFSKSSGYFSRIEFRVPKSSLHWNYFAILPLLIEYSSLLMFALSSQECELASLYKTCLLLCISHQNSLHVRGHRYTSEAWIREIPDGFSPVEVARLVNRLPCQLSPK